MQAYGQDFARIYNVKWSGYAKQVAPLIFDFYASTPTGRTNKSVLDLCCGAGHLAVHFLESGYRVVGLDLSEYILDQAVKNAGKYIESGQAAFIKGDAADFSLNEHFGLVVSTYDSLNHLENEEALISCFRCVHDICDGYFIFDLNTRKGLNNWNNVHVDDGDDDILIITRGEYDGRSDKARTRITGFIGTPNGLYKRFDETVFNTVFDLARVKKALLEVGWKNVYFARVKDLTTPLTDPEDEGRVFIVASK